MLNSLRRAGLTVDEALRGGAMTSIVAGAYRCQSPGGRGEGRGVRASWPIVTSVDAATTVFTGTLPAREGGGWGAGGAGAPLRCVPSASRAPLRRRGLRLQRRPHRRPRHDAAAACAAIPGSRVAAAASSCVHITIISRNICRRAGSRFAQQPRPRSQLGLDMVGTSR